MSTEDHVKLAEIAKQQDDLGNRTAKVMAEMQKDAEKLKKADPSAAAAMSQAATTGQQQNVPGEQAKASKAAEKNQQTQAQAGQKQAEMGLQMMLADLREAEKHKLDELAHKLAELQEQLAVLIRQQAGHNLNNLALQGADVLARLDSVAKADLFEESERDPKYPPPAVDLGMLSSGQEQTERNARDIAKAAEALPEGGEPADHITQAADKMERAIVNLRDSKLAEAYNPAQVDALASLLQAKKLVDEQKKKADEKQDEQKKESIKQSFVAIRAHQDEINSKTIAIDSSPRNEDGTLRRDQLVRLGQLPVEQGKVADEAHKLDEALATLESIVYSWANHDIVKNMDQVKDVLGSAQTGAGTQAQQHQIIAEIDAMIRDLETKPKKSPFIQKASSSGGGGGSPPTPTMPAESELRLIKDLQLAENDATIAISKVQPQPQPKADLLALGNRQGDLRNLLDQVMRKVSKGAGKLPPELDNRDQLPEEAGTDPNRVVEHVENAELDKDLLVGDVGKGAKAENADAGHELNIVGDRMSRSRQRLSINGDAGAVTQVIQQRIIDNLDDLIDQARKVESKKQNQEPKPGKGSKAAPPKPTDAKPQTAEGQKPQPAASPGNTAGGGGAPSGDPGADVAHQDERMWGGVTARQRDAVIESEGEKVLPKYETLVKDYYRTLSAKVGTGTK